MTEHTERFTGRVAEYERYRLRYPVEVLDVLRRQCGLTAAKVVADVGAGTGMLEELFLENGSKSGDVGVSKDIAARWLGGIGGEWKEPR